MLTINILTSAEGASSYYSGTYAYYCEQNGNEKEVAQAIHWQGKGAERLGLSGVVKKEDFDRLLKGKLPSGQQLGRIEKGEVKHRPGIDFTFNAPKSLSVLAYSGVDKRLIGTHDKAVTLTLEYIENLIAQTRVTRDGITTYENARNLVISKFRQATSRENDPHMHTHCVILNLIQGLDGRWRSFSSDLKREQGVMEIAQAWRNTLGMIYRCHLAHELVALGYQIEKTGTDGCFEIAGFPKDLLKETSKRRTQIEKFMQEKGLHGGAEAEKANKATRSKKVEMSPQQLQKECLALLQKYELHLQDIMKEPKNSRWQRLFNNEIRASEKIATKALTHAIAHLSERDAVFSRQHLLFHAMAYAPERCLPGPIEKAIESFLQQKQLLAIEPHTASINGHYFTTPAILAIEAKTVILIKAGQGKMRPLAKSTNVTETLKTSDSALTSEQRQVVHALTQTTDRVFAVQGVPGSGKTRLLRSAHQVALAQDYTLIGAAPTAQAAKLLQRSTDIPSYTLPRLMRELRQQDNLQQTVVVIDEVSMMGSQTLHDIVQLIHEKNSRLWLLGDKAQLSSIEPGNSFALAQLFGMNTAQMTTLMRHQEACDLHQAISASLIKDYQSALNALRDVHVIEDHHERLQKCAELYCQVAPELRHERLVIIPRHKDRAIVHSYIRAYLKEEGTLHGHTLSQEALASRNLTQAQQRHARSYQVGDVIRFNQAEYCSLRLIKAGDYVTVAKTPQRLLDKNRLRLIKRDGKVLTWKLPKITTSAQINATSNSVEVYYRHTIELQVGEQIRFRRNFHEHNITNGQAATISAISDHEISFKTEDGVLTLARDHNVLQHIDLAYTDTVFGIQGVTNKDSVVLVQNPTDLEWLVQISRAKQRCIIVTEDKDKLIRNLHVNLGENPSALHSVRAEQLAQVQVARHLQESFSGLLAQKCAQEGALRQCRARVQNYSRQNELSQRERHAYAILKDFALHLPYLQERDIDLKQLRQDGLNQQRHLQLAGAEPAPRQHYHAVGLYRTVNQLIGQRFSEIYRQPKLATSAQWKTVATDLNPLIQTRDRLALRFIKDPQKYQAALTHYSIGQANTLGYEASQHMRLHSYAEQRLQKCHDYAQRGQDRQFLQSYINEAKIAQRQKMAQHMVENAKSFHPFVIEQSANIKGLWQQLRSGARTHRRNTAFEKLDFKQQQDWLQVEKLVTARRSIARAMQQVNDTKASNATIVIRANEVSRQEFRFYFPEQSQQNLRTALSLRQALIMLQGITLTPDSAYWQWLRLEVLAHAHSQAITAMEDIHIFKTAMQQTQAAEVTQEKATLPTEVQQNLQTARALRDHIVSKIRQRPNDFKAALDFYTLDQVKLQSALTSLACRERVAAFKSGQYDLMTRLNLAAEIIAQKKAHHSAVKAEIVAQQKDNNNNAVKNAQVSWQLLYRYANLAEKHSVLQQVTQPEREDILLVNRYRVCQRQVAKLWQSNQQQQTQATVSDFTQRKALKDEALAATAKRDALAAQIVSELPRYQRGLALTNTRGGRLFDHAEKHSSRVMQVAQWAHKRQTLLSDFEKLSLKHPEQMQTWLSQWQEIARQSWRFSLAIYSQARVTLKIDTPNSKNDCNLQYTLQNLLPESMQQALKTQVPPQPQSHTTTIQSKYWDYKKVKDGLAYEADNLAVQLLGSDYKRSGQQLRYGNKGSFSVNIGASAGRWGDFESGTGGNDLVSFIMHVTHYSFQEALEYGAAFLGLSKEETPLSHDTTYQATQGNSKSKVGFSAEQYKKINAARYLVRKSIPIAGSLAERYLREHRGITMPLPDTLRYLPPSYKSQNEQYFPALLGVSIDKNSQAQSVQLTYLDANTANKVAGLKTSKRSLGSRVDSLCQIQQGSGKTVALAEGIETALSVAQAKPDWEVYITFGVSSMKDVGVEIKAERLILCADNDGPQAESVKEINKVAGLLILQDKTVAIARPEQLGTDFNDLLHNQGTTAVAQQLDKAETCDRSQLLPLLTPQSETLSPEIAQKTQAHLEAQLQQHQDLTGKIKELKDEQTLEGSKQIEESRQPPEKMLQDFEKSFPMNELTRPKELAQEKKQVLEYER